MKLTVVAILSLIILASAAGMWPDLAASRVDLNDNVSHFAMIERIVQTVEHGGNPLDAWSPEWVCGFPMLRDYQTLAHLLVAGIYFALGKSVALMTIFVWVRFLAVVLLPLSFYASARLMELPRPVALAAAAMSPLIVSNGLYGLEYGSYVWAGSGLFPQSVAAHLLLLSLGFGYRALVRGKGLTLAGVLLGLTFLAHLIFGYMGALSLVLAAVLPASETPRALRLQRTLRIGVAAAAISAFQLLALLIDGRILNHSRWEATWKWDAFGIANTLQYLFTGKLLDAERLPVLTIAALGGVAFVIWRWRTVSLAARLALGGAVLWIVLLFGRTFWGPALSLLGISEDMPLHRVAAGAQVYLILLGAIGFGALWNFLAARKLQTLAVAIGLVLLAPAIRERSAYLGNNDKWGRDNLAAYAGGAPAVDATITHVLERGGRVYTGVPNGWGGQNKVGSVPFFAFLSVRQVPAIAYLYHAMALTAENQPEFNEWNPAHYRLYNIRSVVAPAGIQTALPPFWTREQTIGRFDIFATPETGYFDIVDVPGAMYTSKHNFYDVNRKWLQSDWVEKRLHLLLDLGGPVPDRLRLWQNDPLPALPAFPPAGSVLKQSDTEAEVELTRKAYVLFKMTWHPNWKAWVDGRPVATSMLSPGFIGVPVDVGRHAVTVRYEGSAWKVWLLLAGIGVAGALAFAPVSFEMPGWLRLRPAIPLAILIALPVAIPMITSRVVTGDDALGYPMRQVEFHEVIKQGTLIPRWAPDLDRGAGQPLFLFVPPLFHYIAEMWNVAVPDLQTSVNLTVATLVVLLAVGMFLLGRLFFGTLGGYLCAAAAVYAPYLDMDLYVRAALSEFSAFPFCGFAMYGFAAYAREGRRRHLVLGAASYAGVVLSHFLVAFYFTPLLVAFLAVTSKRTMWRRLAVGVALGIGLSAWVWLPILVEGQYVQLERTMQGTFRYTYHLLRFDQLLDTGWGYASAKTFGLGWGHLLIAVAAWVVARDRRWLKFFTAAAVVFCLFTLGAMEWAWEILRVLQRIQFPWRLLGPAAICLAAMAATIGPWIDGLGRWRWPAFGAAMALLVLPNLPHLAPGGYQDLDMRLMTPEYLARSGMETTTSYELTPRWMQAIPNMPPPRARVVAGEGSVDSGLTAHMRTAGVVEFGVAYFPGWDARVDGAPVPMEPALATGLIRAAVPAGDHKLSVEFRRTGDRWAGELISLLALGAVAFLVSRKGAEPKK